MDLSHSERLFRVLLVGIGYFALAGLCHELPTSEYVLSPVWLPSGVAIAGVLLFGRLTLLGIFVADFCASLTQQIDVFSALGLAATGTLEAYLITAVLIAARVSLELDKVRDVLILIGATILGTLTSATLGTFILSSGDFLIHTLDRSWVRYFLSTSNGVLLLTPLILVWSRPLPMRYQNRKVGIEAVALLLLTGAACTTLLLFNWSFIDFLILLPLATWALLRFDLRGVTLTGMIALSFATWGTLRTETVVNGLSPLATVELIQTIFTLFVCTHLLMAACLIDRNQTVDQLRFALDTFDESQRLTRSGSWSMESVDSEKIWISRELSALLGVSRGKDGVVDRTVITKHVTETDRKLIALVVQSAIAKGQPYELEHQLLCADGEYRSFQHTGRIVKYGDSEDRIVSALCDVSSYRQAEEIQALLAKTATSEFRTPLTAIASYSSTLLQTWSHKDDFDKQRFLRTIQKHANEMLSTVESTFLQARIDAGELAPDVQPFQLKESLDAAVEGLDSGTAIDIDCSPSIVVLGDENLIRQAIHNLASNAIQYGSAPFKISAKVFDQVDVELRVEDSGGGVSEEFVPRMFERFTRGSHNSAPGSGLGLSISRGLVNSIGGSIEYERKGGKTAFVIKLRSA